MKKGMFKKWLLICVAIILSLSLIGCGASKSTAGNTSGAAGGDKTKNEGQASKYPEKTIELVVGYKPGGGYSDWALALAPYLEKNLPHKVSVVVRHMDGAGSALAANFMQKAKPDGYTISIYNVAGLAATQLASDVNYDLSKVTWLGRLSLDPTVAMVSSKGPYKSIEDFKKQSKPKYIIASKGLAATNTISGAITLSKLGVKWEPLNHSGTGEAMLSIIRGESDITWGSYDSVKQYIDNGDVKPIIYYDVKRHPKMPDTPIPSELGMPDLNETMNSHRIIGAPPGLPDDIKAILEEAIKKAAADPGFIDKVNKMKLSVDYLNAKDSERVVKDLLKSYDAYKDIVKDLMSKDK